MKFYKIQLFSNNLAMTNLMMTIEKIHDESFPTVTTRKTHYDNSKKDFMTTALLKSCRVKDKMYKTIVKNKISRESAFYQRFKDYRNILNSLIRKQKKRHYDELLTIHKNDVKKTIDLVNMMINKSNDKHSITSASFRINGVLTDNKKEIAQGFNKFFSEIGPKTNEKVGSSQYSSESYLRKKEHNPSHQFTPRAVDSDYVMDIVRV